MMASFSAYSTTETFHEKSFVTGVIFALLGSFSPNIRGSRLRVWLLAKFGGLLSRMELRTGIMIPRRVSGYESWVTRPRMRQKLGVLTISRLDFHTCSTRVFLIVTGEQRLSTRTGLVQAGLSRIWCQFPELNER